MVDIRQEYERVYRNYQICLEGLENIVLYAESKQDKELADKISYTISRLDTIQKINN